MSQKAHNYADVMQQSSVVKHVYVNTSIPNFWEVLAKRGLCVDIVHDLMPCFEELDKLLIMPHHQVLFGIMNDLLNYQSIIQFHRVSGYQ